MEDKRTQVVGVRLEPDLINFLKNEAEKQSNEKHINLTYVDLIRNAIGEKFDKKIHDFMYSDAIESLVKKLGQTLSWNKLLSMLGAKEQSLLKEFDTEENRVNFGLNVLRLIYKRILEKRTVCKLLNVDMIATGGQSRYEANKMFHLVRQSYETCYEGSFSVAENNGVDCLVNTFELASNIYFKLMDLREMNRIRDYSIFVKELIDVLARDIISEERLFFKLLNEANPLVILSEIDNNALDIAIKNYQKVYGKGIDIIAIMHPDLSSKLFQEELFDRDDIEYAYSEEHSGKMKVYSLLSCPKNSLYLIPPKDNMVMPVIQDVTVLPADDPKRLMLGYIIYREIGMALKVDDETQYGAIICRDF